MSKAQTRLLHALREGAKNAEKTAKSARFLEMRLRAQGRAEAYRWALAHVRRYLREQEAVTT